MLYYLLLLNSDLSFSLIIGKIRGFSGVHLFGSIKLMRRSNFMRTAFPLSVPGVLFSIPFDGFRFPARTWLC